MTIDKGQLDIFGGHNAEPKKDIHALIERVERLEKERADLAQDVREVYLEAKLLGYDVKRLRKLVTLRKKDPAVIAKENEALLQYADFVGYGGIFG